jgi:hypothetical protein
MKKMLVTSAFMLVFGAASMAQTADVKAAEPKSGAAMKFEKEEYNFGTIKSGDKVEYAFEFVNTGKEPLIISQASGSCGCTVPEYPKNPIAKGEKGVIKVTFNSTGKVGLQDKTVTITSNAPDSPKILHIKGTVEQVANTAAPEAKPMEKPQN